MTSHLLSIIIFSPLIFLIAILILPSQKKEVFKYITLASASIQLILSIIFYFKFQYVGNAPKGVNMESGFQFIEKANWIDLKLGRVGNLSVEYFLGLDGLSISMLLLSSIVLFVGAIASWNINKNSK